MIDEVLKAGLLGIQRGVASAVENAQKITQAGLPGSNLSLEEPLIGLKQDRIQIEAAGKVVKTASDLQATILDILA